MFLYQANCIGWLSMGQWVRISAIEVINKPPQTWLLAKIKDEMFAKGPITNIYVHTYVSERNIYLKVEF